MNVFWHIICAGILASDFILILGLCFLFIRNNWVHTQRLRMIDEDWEAYTRLPSYNEMLWRVWVWDVRRFVRHE